MVDVPDGGDLSPTSCDEADAKYVTLFYQRLTTTSTRHSLL